jgi:hypothetical protein
VSIGAGLAALVETAIDVEEVGDLGELVRRQLGQVSNLGIGGLTLGDTHQLRLAAVPSYDPEDSNRPGPHPHPRVGRLGGEHQRVERFVIGSERAWNEAVVGRKGEGAGQSSVEPDQPGVLVELVLVATAPWSLHHDIDRLHIQQDRGNRASGLCSAGVPGG